MEPERSASAAAQSAEAFRSRTFQMVGLRHVRQSVNVSSLFSSIVLSEGKAVLTIGHFVVVADGEKKPEPLPGPSEASDADSMQSDGSAAVEPIVSGSATSRSEFDGTSRDVVMVSHDPAATLALWLPGQLKEGLETVDDSEEQVEGSRKLASDLLEVQNVVQESENPHPNKIGESPVKIWLAKFGFVGKNSAAEAGSPLLPEMDVPNVEVLGQRQARPVIRSKLEFSKRMDGSQTLSYEEEVARKDEDHGISDCLMRNRGRPGLRSAFLDLIRYVSMFIVEADSSE